MSTADSRDTPGYQAYFRALDAHKQVQAQYESLKSELDILTKQNAKDCANELASRKIAAGDLVPLLHQREMVRKLKIIETAFSGITKDNPVDVVVDDFTRTRAGEMPPPPTATARPISDQAVDQRMAELNKALLSAMYTVKEHHAARSTANPTAASSPEAQVYALEQARNALITWIEEKLVVIGEAQAANAKPPETLQVADEEPPIPVSAEEISQIYEQYISARKNLLHALQHPIVAQYEASMANTQPTRTASIRNGDDSGMVAASLLPYIASLSILKDDEEARAKLSDFSIQSLAQSERENAQLLSRLAKESHLVQPGAKDVAAWSAASDAARSTSAQHVHNVTRDTLSKTMLAQHTIHTMEQLPKLLQAREDETQQ